MNIYLHELKSNWKAFAIWSISIILILVMGYTEFTSIKGHGSQFTELFKNMPKSIQALMGGGAFDFSTAIGYYAVLFLYLVLMITIHAALLGAGIIAKEENDKTVEFLLVKPVKRNKVITAKLLAALTMIVLINLITLITSLSLYHDTGVIKLMIGLFLLQILFMSLGAFIAAYKKNPKNAGGITIGVLLFTYMISIVVDIVEIQFLRYLTPFKYFDAKTLLIEEGFNVFLILLTLVLSAFSIYSTYHFYEKRDLNH